MINTVIGAVYSGHFDLQVTVLGAKKRNIACEEMVSIAQEFDEKILQLLKRKSVLLKALLSSLN